MTGSFGTMWRARSARLLATAAAASILIGGAAPAFAQEVTDARLKKVESEVRALQRKVFPGADGKFFEAEIKPAPAPIGTPAVPSSTPVTDLLTRMDAIEAQMAGLTSQVEQNTNRLNQIEAKLAGAAPSTTVVAGPPAAVFAPSTPAMTPTPLPTPAPTTSAAPQSNLSAMTGGASAKPAPVAAAGLAASKPAAPASSRVTAVRAIVKPQSDDPGDDEYSYGYRLWEAKFYPEAEQQLKLYLEKYPKHARASYGRNLLGRAYIDDGNPSEAAKWFLQNFQNDKRGDRAPDSLLYLAISMKQLKDTKRACIALAEFGETYAAEAAGRLASLYTTTRNGLTCN